MLFYVGFAGDLVPLLIDAKDAERASAIALEVAKEAPSRVVEFPPGVFVAELFAEDEDGNEVVIDPLDHVVDILNQIDAIDVDPAPPLVPLCGLEADGPDGELVTCGLDAKHAGDGHEGLSSSGELVTWTAA